MLELLVMLAIGVGMIIFAVYAPPAEEQSSDNNIPPPGLM